MRVERKAKEESSYTVKREPERSEFASLLAEERVYQAEKDRIDWVVDSGATCHMTGNKQLFVRLDFGEIKNQV